MEGVGEGAGSLGSLHPGPGLPAEGAPGFTQPRRPPGSSQTRGAPIPAGLGLGGRAGDRGDSVEAEAAARDPSLATHGYSWLCPGCLQQSQSIKKKKKKNTDLVDFCFQSGQGKRTETGAGVPHAIPGTPGSQAEPLQADGGGHRPRPAPKGSPSSCTAGWGGAGRGRGRGRGGARVGRAPHSSFPPRFPGPPPQVRLRVV